MKTRFAAAFLAVAAALRAGDARPAVTVRVVNEAGLDSRSLAQASNSVTRIFRDSGIDLIWMVCEDGPAVWGSSDPCHRGRGASEFWMNITASKPRQTSGEVLGFTVLDEAGNGGSSGVHLPAVEELVTPGGARLGDILGAAMAHELGHLLLGADSHSLTGVITPHWGRPEMERISIGELNFARYQAKLLRERIERRTLSMAVGKR